MKIVGPGETAAKGSVTCRAARSFGSNMGSVRY